MGRERKKDAGLEKREKGCWKDSGIGKDRERMLAGFTDARGEKERGLERREKGC